MTLYEKLCNCPELSHLGPVQLWLVEEIVRMVDEPERKWAIEESGNFSLDFTK